MKGFWKYLCLVFLGIGLFLLSFDGESLYASNRNKAKNQGKPSPAGVGHSAFVSGEIAVKFKKDIFVLGKSSSAKTINAKIQKHNVYAIERAFPFLTNSEKKRADELLRVYFMKFDSRESPQSVAADFAADGSVEYASVVPVFKVDAIPNDPQFAQQSQLPVVKALQAWDIVKGDTGQVVIAIVDGGTDWQHEDLAANIWENEDEIADNGIDDDNNGFVDDIRGWNFANSSNDPRGRASQPTNYQHGTAVAGIAGAVTDNATGISGMSWNCTIMPVNVADVNASNDSTLGDAFEGVVYAIDNDADIINASWGVTASLDILQVEEGIELLQMAQDIADFGLANGSLIVTSAGNTGEDNSTIFNVPANINGVLAVGSTTNFDTKSFFSNYGFLVPVFAPGEGLQVTYPDNSYSPPGFSGTSAASPLVAGIAGLVKTQHPDWSADQVREQIRVTADNIDLSNPGFAGKMGNGRVNAFKAVSVSSPAVQIAGVSFADSGGDGRADVGETVNLSVLFTNYLESVTNLSFTLTSEDANISLINPNADIAALNTGDTSSVNFQFSLASPVPDGYNAEFITNISSSQYNDRDFFDISINPPQVLDHNTGTVTVSITNKGNIGFTGFADVSPGSGFIFKGTNLLFEGSFIVGTGPSTVSDAIRAGVSSDQDDDFRPISELTLTEGQVSDEFGHVILDDSFAESPIGVEVTQESFAYKEEPFTDFIIFKYTIKNISGSNISNLWAGLFFDWDINTDANDYVRFDQSKTLGYALNNPANATQIAATKVLTPLGTTSFRAIDNPPEIYGGTGNDGFTANEKWTFLSSGIQTQSLDVTDISTMTSTGPFNLNPDEQVEVAFAVIGASSISELGLNAELAQQLWNNDLIPVEDISPPITSTSVFQNPAASKYADIVVISDRLLENSPTVRMAVGTDTTTVSMTLIDGTTMVYRGPFEFTQTGPHTILTNATSATNGIDSTQSRTFNTALAKPGVAGQLSTINKQARLYIGENTLQNETFFIADFKESDDVLFSFGPKKEFNNSLTLEINYDKADFTDPGKIFIFQKQGEEWTPLETRVFSAEQIARAEVYELGDFKLAYDPDFDGTNLVPAEFTLSQNYPNPFNPTTIIEYALPIDDIVELTVFNALGQTVKTLYRGRQLAGNYQVKWNGTDDRGIQVASGVFFYRIKAGDFVKIRKMILLR